MAGRTTRVFDVAAQRGMTLGDLSKAMGIDRPTLTRVKQGRVGVTLRFVDGAERAFPEYARDWLCPRIDDDAAAEPAGRSA